MSTTLRNPPQPPPLPGEGPRPAPRTEYIDTQIDKTRGLVKWTEIALHGVVLGTLLLGALLLLALLDHWVVGLGGWGRGLAFLAIGAGTVYYFVRWIVPPIWQSVNPVYAAHTIEEAQPELKNSLVNFLFFRTEPQGVRTAVLTALEERAATDLTRAPVDTAVDRSQLIQASYILAGVLTLFALYTVLSPKDPFATIARVAFPWADIARPSRVQIEDVQPGHATTYYGYEVVVSANVRGVSEQDPVTLVYSTADGQVDKREVRLTRGDDGLRYQTKLPPEPTGAEQAMTYQIFAGDAETPLYRIEVLPAPSITVRGVHYDYPEYTGELDRDVERDGDLRGIEGTRVTLHVEANHEIKSGYVEFDPGTTTAAGEKKLSSSETAPLVVDGKNTKQAEVTFPLLLKPDRRTPRNRTYQVRFVNEQGDRNERPIEHAIEVLPDQSPTVEILTPAQREIELSVGGEQPIEVRALDPDFKLTRVTLRAVARGVSLFDAPLLETPAGTVGQTLPPPFVFRPREHRLQPGDVVVFWAEAADNRTSPHSRLADPNVSASEKFTIKVTAPRPGEPPNAGNPPPMGENRPGENNAGNNGQGNDTPPPDGDPNGMGKPRDPMQPQGGQGNGRPQEMNPGQPNGQPMQPGQEGNDPRNGQPGGGQGANGQKPGAEDRTPRDPGAAGANNDPGAAGQKPPMPGENARDPGEKKPSEQPNQDPMGGQKPPRDQNGKKPDPNQPAGQDMGDPGAEQGNTDPRNKKPMGGASGKPGGEMGDDNGGQEGAGASGGQNDKGGSAKKPNGGTDQGGADQGGASGADGNDPGGEEDPAAQGDPRGKPSGGRPKFGGRKDPPENTPLDDSGRDDGEIFDRALKQIEQDIREKEGEEGVQRFRKELEEAARRDAEQRGGGKPGGGAPQQPMGGGPMGVQPMGGQTQQGQPMSGGDQNMGRQGTEPMPGNPQENPGGASGGQQPMGTQPMNGQPMNDNPMGAGGNMGQQQPMPGGAQGMQPMPGGADGGGQEQPMPGGMKPGEQPGGASVGTQPMGQQPMKQPGGGEQNGMTPGGAQGMTPMGQQPGGAKPMMGESSGGMNQGQGPMKPGGEGSQGGMPQGGAETEMQPMGQKPGGSQDGGMGQNGNTGGGMKPMGQKPGAPESQGGGQQGNKPQESKQGQSGSQGEGQSPSTSKKPSQSQGGEGGDKSGGGSQGGGQGGMQPGNDSAGGSTPGDDGAGQANDQGSGDNGKKGGMGQVANQPTGQAGNQQGEGSTTTKGDGKKGPGSAAQKTSRPGEQTGQNGKQPRAGQNASNTPGNQPGGGGPGSPNDLSPPPNGVVPPAGPDLTQHTVPDPDPEYAKKATQLTLEYLRDQADNPDPELLKRLGANPNDKAFLKRFVERWEKMYRDAALPDATGQKAKQELDETLRGLGLRKQSDSVRSGDLPVDGARDQDVGRSRPPREYEDLYRAYNKGLRGLKTTP